jgi:VWFA-related protein
MGINNGNSATESLGEGMRRFCLHLAWPGLALLTAASPAQKPPAPDSGNIVIHSSVQEVVLDVVVRRKNQSLVTTLKASDFTVTEDGVPQTIQSFRFVGGKEAGVVVPTPPPAGLWSGAAAARAICPTAVPPIAAREPNFISIVFDQMGAGSRQNALQAATDFLNQEFQNNTRAAIFRLNLRVNVIHGFTNDRQALSSAVQLALNGTAPELAAASANVLNETDYTLNGGPGGASFRPEINLTHASDFSMSGASANPLSETQEQLAALITNQRGMVDSIAGMRTWDSLLQIIRYE